jgi:putative SOS response-associated peptidase YedK
MGFRCRPSKTTLDDDRPLFAFAGLWTRWHGVRGPKNAPVAREHQLFGFLTTEANAVIAPIHPKAMRVILTTPAEFDRWLGSGHPRRAGVATTVVGRRAQDSGEGREGRWGRRRLALMYSCPQVGGLRGP